MEVRFQAASELPGAKPVSLIALTFFAISGMICVYAKAADEPSAISMVIRDHRFKPDEVEIPAGEKRLFEIDNQDATAEEFESHTMHREKILPPRSTTKVYIGPLKPGRYEFYGEFNDSTAHGVVIVK